jgi:hypothetical protein
LIVPPLRKRVPKPLTFRVAPDAMVRVVSISPSAVQFMVPFTVSGPVPRRRPLANVRAPLVVTVPAFVNVTSWPTPRSSVCVPVAPPPTASVLKAGVTSRLTVYVPAASMTTSVPAVGTEPLDQFEAVFQLPPLLLIQCTAVRTVNVAALVPVPPAVMTAIAPVVAETGTVAVSCELLLPVKVAAVPLNLTALTAVKSVPVMTTLAPLLPELGVKPVTVGAGAATLHLPNVPAP